jgi:hypothetical protein
MINFHSGPELKLLLKGKDFCSPEINFRGVFILARWRPELSGHCMLSRKDQLHAATNYHPSVSQTGRRMSGPTC